MHAFDVTYPTSGEEGKDLRELYFRWIRGEIDAFNIPDPVVEECLSSIPKPTQQQNELAIAFFLTALRDGPSSSPVQPQEANGEEGGTNGEVGGTNGEERGTNGMFYIHYESSN